MHEKSYAVDLITFFHPTFWGVEDERAVVEFGRAEPRRFWDRMLDTLAVTGIGGIELTFAPFDWRTAVAAYDSVAAFAHELARRQLRVVSGFFADVAIGGGLHDPSRSDAYVADAVAYADVLAALGAGVMVMGLPMRQSWDAEPPLFVDLTTGQEVATFCHRLGSAILRRGIRLALHTEAHSIFCTARDVDLLMILTDPIYVGFCPDTAHITLAGSDPLAVVERHKDRVVAIHWKDAVRAGDLRDPIDETIHHRHREYFATIGEGTIDWRKWSDLIERIGFAGPSILELDAAADPAGELRRSLVFVGTLRSAATVPDARPVGE